MARVLPILLALTLLLCLGVMLVFLLLPGFPGNARPAEAPPESAPAGDLLAVKKELRPASESPSQEGSPASGEEPSSASAENAAHPPPDPASAESASPPPPDPVSPPAEEPLTPPPAEDAWMIRLVNWANPLPVDFAPEYEAVQNRFVLDKRVAPIARQMIADAQAQGVTLVVNSAYRPYSSQQLVYDAQFQRYLAQGRTEEEARRLTDSYVAAPGCSEHQLGLAMDIVEAAEAGKEKTGWLTAHAPDYGFVLRYPEDKTAITRTAYESWHYRYVGVPAAREMTSRGLCLEEYLAELARG